MNRKCNCCKKETTELDLFKYTYGNRIYNLCGICYANVDDYMLTKSNNITLKLTPFEIRKIQLNNERLNYRIKNLDLTIFPRTFLEDFINYIKEKNFNNFKRLLTNYEKDKQLKIIFN